MASKFSQRHKMIHQNISAKLNTHVTDAFVLMITEILHKKKQLRVSRLGEEESMHIEEEVKEPHCRFNCDKCSLIWFIVFMIDHSPVAFISVSKQWSWTDVQLFPTPELVYCWKDNVDSQKKISFWSWATLKQQDRTDNLLKCCFPSEESSV